MCTPSYSAAPGAMQRVGVATRGHPLVLALSTGATEVARYLARCDRQGGRRVDGYDRWMGAFLALLRGEIEIAEELICSSVKA